MTLLTRTTSLSFVLLSTLSLTLAQGFDPFTPSKEYLRFGGQIVAIENAPAAPAPVAQLSATTLVFGSQALGTPSANQTVTGTSTGNAGLVFSSSPALGGSNPGDFNISGSGCEPAAPPLGSGAFCGVTVNFMPQFPGSRSATLTFTDNAGTSPQTVTLSGTGSGAAAPSLTTYLGSYGSGVGSISGPVVTLPIRAYYSGGAAQTNYVQTTLGPGYTVLAEQNGSGRVFPDCF